ncbi:glycosyltransferase [Streptomyces sp. NP160]|uniref:glycosyltransferase family 2 protein n=1 Tax=Streptomyces sp. NP160 TaxID=2586637 RepID=UPI00111828B1|nr:glycosyltransferase family A protein [Streptomyces sp. NP160]TNM63235.1 glycosyltransferase [Streptomyces sp. NP160]
MRTVRLVGAASAAAVVVAVHTAVNAALLRRPAAAPPAAAERVSVLLPARDEAHQVGRALAAVLASTGVPDLEVLVLDDGSTDGTAAAAVRAAGGDPRVRVLTGTPLPPGWLGKPHALAQLAAAASGSVLVCLDADVRVAPHALAATVDLLRRHGLALVSPYPRQEAVSAAERLVQPLLQWSWLATLPLRLAERSPRPSLSAANGQLMALDAAALSRAGGFAAVRAEVLDDVALVRAVKAAGGRGGVVDGTDLATCRMYDGWPAVRDGYAKSLWSATGSPAAALSLVAGLGAVFVLPAVAAVTGAGGGRGRLLGLLGYGAGVASRVVAARRTGGRAWPDAMAHPASVAVLGGLVVRSWRLRRAGGLAWKGRALP